MAGSEKEGRGPTKGSLAVIFAVVVIDLLGFGLVLPLLPIYAKQFTTDQTGITIGLLMASFSFMQLCFSPIWGALSDKVGRRPVLMVGLAGSVVFYFIFGLATTYQSLTWIFVSRIGAGICAATISTAQAYIADTTTEEKRAKGMALVGLAFGIGFTFGPVIGYFAVPEPGQPPGPWPGYVASLLSAIALVMAVFLLPESLVPGKSAKKRKLGPMVVLDALKIAGVPVVLATIFIVVFSFANFETTLAMLVEDKPFDFSFKQICGMFAFIGFTLALIQGGVVRPLSTKISEVPLAVSGALMEIVGFLLVCKAISDGSVVLLMVSLIIIVTGFSCMQPSVHSLLSRYTPADKQGLVLGTGQSVNSLARILGAGLSIPFLKLYILLPYLLATVLMAVGGFLLWFVLKGVPLKESRADQ